MSLLTMDGLQEHARAAAARDHDPAKWVLFSTWWLYRGYEVRLYRAKRTVSKYVTVTDPARGVSFKVRFSDHKPILRRELDGDCDFFVGITNFDIHTTYDAVAAASEYFGERYDPEWTEHCLTSLNSKPKQSQPRQPRLTALSKISLHP